MRREAAQLHTDEGVGSLAGAHDLLSNPFGEVDRHREAQTRSRGLANGRVHADHFAGGTDQGSPAIAGIDGCIRLDVRNPLTLADVGIGPIDGTDDACGDGVVQTKGIPDGDGPFPRAQLVGIAETRHRQVLSHHLHHRNVRQRIAAENGALETAPVGQRHIDPIRSSHHMLVGEDQAVGSCDEPRPLALLPLGGGAKAEQLTHRVVDVLLGVDPHHGRTDPLDRFDDHILPGL